MSTPSAPPHDLAAEQIVLGTMMLNRQAAARIFQLVSVDDFYADRHRALADIIRQQLAADAPVDPVAIARAASNNGHRTAFGTDTPGIHIHACYAQAATITDGLHHARALVEYARRRHLLTITSRAREAITSGADADQIIDQLTIELAAAPHAPDTTSPIPAPLSARDVCALDVPDDEQLLGPLVVRGQRIAIGAHTGQGKTTFSMQLLASIVDARDMLGWKGAGGRALIIDAEQGLRSLQRRLREARLADSDRIDIIRIPDGLSLDQNHNERGALDKIFDTGHYDVVLADPLYKLHAGEANDERQAIDLMKIFDRWRDQHGFALLMPVHCRKPSPIGGKFSMHEFFGSSAYLRGAEVILGLQLVRQGYSRLHWFKDRDGDLPIASNWGLFFDRDNGYRRDPADDQKPTTPERILELLNDDPGRTAEQIAEELHLTTRTVKATLQRTRCVAKTGARGLKVWYPPASDDEPEPDLSDDEEAMF